MNTHLHLCLAECIREFGPVYGFWCFSFEGTTVFWARIPISIGIRNSIEIRLMRKFIQTRQLVNLDSNRNERSFDFLLKSQTFKGSLLVSVSPAMVGKSIDRLVTTNFSVDFSIDDSVRVASKGKRRVLTSEERSQLQIVFSKMHPNSSVDVIHLVESFTKAVINDETYIASSSMTPHSTCVYAPRKSLMMDLDHW